MRDNMIGIGFKNLPESALEQFNISGEILKLSMPKEDCKRFYVTYELFIKNKDIVLDYESFKHQLTADEFQQCFPVSSTTQTSRPYFSRSRNQSIASFSFPLDFQLIKRMAVTNEETESDQTPSDEVAFLFEVFSLDGSNINRYEGHSVMYLPLKPGHYTKSLHINREILSTFDEIKRYFVGGISTIKNKQDFVFKPHISNSIQNYSRKVLVNAGVLDVRLNICHFSEETKKIHRELNRQQKIKERVAKQLSEDILSK